MRLGVLTSTVAACAALVLVPSSAMANYTLRFCDSAQPGAPGGARGWAAAASGGAMSGSAVPAAWADSCSHPSPWGQWQGFGGSFGATTYAGGSALVKYTPPAGASILGLRARMDGFVSSGSYGAAGMWTTSGQWMRDQSGSGSYADMTSGGQYVNTSTEQWGAADSSDFVHRFTGDAADGIMWGAVCPSSLPPAAGGICGGAGWAMSSLEIYVGDPTPPVLQASAELQGDGTVRVAWTASDPQSGVAVVEVSAGPAYPGAAFPSSCSSLAIEPPCETTVSGTKTLGPIAPGQSLQVTVKALPGRDGSDGAPGEWTKTVTRPAPTPIAPPTPTLPVPVPPVPSQPTPTPTPTPTSAPTARVTLKAKAKRGKRVRLSGKASGCSRVLVRVPHSKRSKRVKVRKSGRWSVTLRRTRGTYRAKCGDALAKRKVK